MGYWFAPSPKAFDPVARPLSFEVQNGMFVPLALDGPIVAAIAQTALGQSKGAGVAYDLLIRTRPPADSGIAYTKEENIGGAGSKTVAMTRWTSGDLPDGGLPPDTVNPDGTWTRHYWDLSDGNLPRRKCATRGSTEEGKQWERIMQWNIGAARWEEEGGDAEREAVEHFQEIMTIVMVIVRLIASATGVGAPAAAMLGIAMDMWKMGLSQVQIRGWEPPPAPLTADRVLGELGSDFIGLCSAIGRTDAFGIMANEAQKTFSSLMTSGGAYLPIKGMEEIGGSIRSSVDQTVKFLGGVSNINGREDGALKIDPQDVFRFAGELIQTGSSANIVPVAIRSKLPDEPESDPATLNINTDYRRGIFEAACLAFYSPADVLLLRRNAIMAWRTRSTILSPSEESAGARGISESQETALECGFAFDSYLAQMFASKRAIDRVELTLEPVKPGFIAQGIPTAAAQSDLDRAVRSLLTRYGAAHHV